MKYTITLNYMIQNQITIWTTDFETNVVATYFDTTFTAEKWTALKSLFNKKYLYREIGFETPDLFRYWIELTFEEEILNYKQKLKAYNLMTSNPYSNNQTDVTEQTDFEDLPMTPLDTSTHLSTRSTRKSQGKSRSNLTEIEMFDDFSKKVRDLDDEFIEKFNNCFMLIY